MYGTTEDAERTAFKLAEKKYKLYYDNNSLKSSKRKTKLPKQVDLSDVLDFNSILHQHSLDENSQLPPGIVALDCDFHRPVFGLETHPGFYFIPGALTVEEQCRWIRESLTNFPQPPNRTNHNAIYGPIHNLFDAASVARTLVEVESPSATFDSENDSSIRNKDTGRWKFLEKVDVFSAEKKGKSVSASHLLRKLRWSTLGLQFDWSKRNYNLDLPHQKIPEDLCQVAKRMAAPAMPTGEEFEPEAAIVNYFASGDTLGGHLDDMEADWSKPIVSMSLGCKAIFLLGGKTRQETPLAMFLRSGDIVLMSGQARECFHGIPRIFANEENVEISPLEFQFSSEDDACFLEYIRTSRININIRQVF